jgi:hypothetical protein
MGGAGKAPRCALRAANEVLVTETGIVLARIADQVHSGAQKLQLPPSSPV